MDVGHWTFLNVHLAAGDDHRWSTYLYLFNSAGLAANVEIDPAGTMHKVALFDYEFLSTIYRFNSGRAVMDQVAT